MIRWFARLGPGAGLLQLSRRDIRRDCAALQANELPASMALGRIRSAQRVCPGFFY